MIRDTHHDVRGAEEARAAALAVEGLTKRYGATTALADVSFTLAAGEVLAVLGQNGAGKSTLVKMLAGVVPPTTGTVRVDGEEQPLGSARTALGRGIVLIPQELAYVPALSVAENIVLGDWAARRGVVSPARVRAAAAPFAEQVGLDVALDTPMSRLSLAECQLAEIAKALSRRARVLLLDEPTAALSDAESLRLFAALGRLREQGVAMIYISHRLDEVLARTDRLLVLRDGRMAATYPSAEATRERVIADMLGAHAQPLTEEGRVRHRPEGRARLSLRGLSHRGRGLRDLSLDVGRGEVVGLFGVAGAGHETVALTLAGLLPHAAGDLFVDGVRSKPLKTPRQARRAGILYVPPERKTQGLVLGQSIRKNLTFPQLPAFARFGVMNRRAEERLVDRAAQRLSLRYAGSAQPVGQLSGGNQQKVMIAGRIYADPAVLVIQEPTRGVDVAARDEIHELLVQIADGGVTILFATSDVEEAVALSDRLLVLRDGRVQATLTAGEKTQANALAAAGKIETEGA